MNKILKRLFHILYTINKVKWGKFFSLYKRNAPNVIWIYPSFPKKIYENFFSATFENDFAILFSLIENNLTFKISVGPNKIKKEKNKTIYYNLSQIYNYGVSDNYVKAMLNELVDIEANQNTLVPNIANVEYWENKAFMHRQFIAKNISHPKTLIATKNLDTSDLKDLKFPVLLKLIHSSGSLGITKYNDTDSLMQHVRMEQDEFLIQEQINMSKDIRVIFVDEEMVLHYWRINNSSEWKPTSTGHGSSVDFESFPHQWYDYILTEFKKLDLMTGAFDITWQNDDMTTLPLILEVSPSYMPNPAPPEQWKNKPYSDYKKTYSGKGNYTKSYIDLVFSIKLKIINHYLEK